MAGHLGATVEELKQRISWAEFVDWMAFDHHHGLDDVRLEKQIALIAATFAASKGGNCKPGDFRPYWKPPKQTEAQQRDAIKKAKRE